MAWNNRPIRTRPWKRPPWRKKRPGFWFVPSVDSVGGNDDPRFSSWSDSDIALGAQGNTLGLPARLVCPIVWNVSESLTTANINDESMFRAHPLAEAWRVERIVGDLVLAAQVAGSNPQLVNANLMIVDTSIQLSNTLGDAVVTWDVEANDSANARRTLTYERVLMCPPNVKCHVCDTDSTTNSQPPVETTGTTATAITDVQTLGVPAARIVHYDIRPRCRVRPEQTVSLIVQFNCTFADSAQLFAFTKIRAFLTKGM